MGSSLLLDPAPDVFSWAHLIFLGTQQSLAVRLLFEFVYFPKSQIMLIAAVSISNIQDIGIVVCI